MTRLRAGELGRRLTPDEATEIAQKVEARIAIKPRSGGVDKDELAKEIADEPNHP